MPEKLMTIKDVAEYMQLGVISVTRMIARNEIPHIRVGKGRGSIRIVPEDFEKYIKTKSEVSKCTSKDS